jgi:hypothetical protein
MAIQTVYYKQKIQGTG